ncbi:type II secretion system protein [Kiritimatiellota bacterium B12222]|nr:type II secretion system protein [Kiritimatiellota bacterium B12222]
MKKLSHEPCYLNVATRSDVKSVWCRGFTLIEMLVVIAILALLMSLILPVVKKSLAKGRAVACMSNLHQNGVAFMTYIADNRAFPPLEKDGLDWGELIYNTADGDPVSSALFCPEDAQKQRSTRGARQISYAYNWIGLSGQGRSKVNNSLVPATPVDLTMLDDPAETVVLMDAGINNGIHVTPSDTRGKAPVGYFYCRPWFDKWNGYPYPRHNGVCNILWADGRVQAFVAPDGTAESMYSDEALGHLWNNKVNHWTPSQP